MNQLAHDYKYTDRDVREDSRLTELAEAYLRTYGGEFEPLIEAKHYLRVVGPMPTAMVRRTLNCMRQDTQVAGQMPVPQRAFVVDDFTTPSPGSKQPKTTRVIRRAFDLRCRWNMDYYAATSKQATAYHLLDKELSTIRYWPETGEYQERVRSMCGVHLATGVLLAAQPDGRHECRQCVAMTEERARRQAERDEEAARMRGDNL